MNIVHILFYFCFITKNPIFRMGNVFKNSSLPSLHFPTSTWELPYKILDHPPPPCWGDFPIFPAYKFWQLALTGTKMLKCQCTFHHFPYCKHLWRSSLPLWWTIHPEAQKVPEPVNLVNRKYFSITAHITEYIYQHPRIKSYKFSVKA